MIMIKIKRGTPKREMHPRLVVLIQMLDDSGPFSQCCSRRAPAPATHGFCSTTEGL